MPTTHLIFDAQQRPFLVPSTREEFTTYSCNFICMTDGVSLTWLEEVAQKLDDAGLATRNSNMFLNRQAIAPTGDGPFVRLIATGGLSPDISYGSTHTVDKPGLQVLVSGVSGDAVRDKALAIYSNLIASVNVSL